MKKPTKKKRECLKQINIRTYQPEHFKKRKKMDRHDLNREIVQLVQLKSLLRQ